MANEPSKTTITATPQSIPLSKIHDLPGIYNPKPQDKSLGSMVLSIETSGVKEPVILRQRDDGEYQLLSGYRRRRACELAKKQDIPAHVYEMSVQDAIAYRKAVKSDPNAPIPGKIIDPSVEKSESIEAPAVPGDKDKKIEAPAVPGDKDKKGEAPAAPSDKDKKNEAPAAPGDKAKEEVPASPTAAELEAKVKAGERVSLTDIAAAEKAERESQHGKEARTATDKDKPGQTAAADSILLNPF